MSEFAMAIDIAKICLYQQESMFVQEKSRCSGGQEEGGIQANINGIRRTAITTVLLYGPNGWATRTRSYGDITT